MARKVFINLPVRELDRSIRFYEAVGATKNPHFSNEQAAAMVFSDSIYVMLLTHDFYQGFTGKPIADARQSSGVLIALSCDNREEVDAIVEAAAAAGGRADPGPVQEHGFMYGRSFEDPDGHHWEPHWMDPAAAAPAQPETEEA